MKRPMPPSGRLSRLVLALVGVLAAGTASAQDSIPSEGEDVVLTSDGRVLRGRVAEEKEGTILLTIRGAELRLPKSLAAEVRLFNDWDPAPRDDEERKKAEAGMSRWGGRWVYPAQRATLQGAEKQAADRRFEDRGAHIRRETAWQVDSKHFMFRADLPRRELDAYISTLERFEQFFTGAFKVNRQGFVAVEIFRRREEFQSGFQASTGGKAENVVGYFAPSRYSSFLSIFLFDWRGNRRQTVRVLLHEATHLFLHRANPAAILPLMMNEGLAEYYGATIVRDGRFECGGIQEERLIRLREMIDANAVIPLEELLWRGHGGAGASFGLDEYAQSWAFVHFVFHHKNGKYLPAFSAWLNTYLALKPGTKDAVLKDGRISRTYGDDCASILRQFKVKDFATLQGEFVEYLKGLPMEGAAFHAARAARDFAAGRDADAEESLRKALELGGDDPGILRDLGISLALRPGRGKDADALLARAIDADPLNVPLRYELSAWLSGRDAEVPHLRLCVELDPTEGESSAARAVLALRGLDRERLLAPPAKAEALRSEIASLGAGKSPSRQDLLRMAEASLLLGDPASALDAAGRAMAMGPADDAVTRIRAIAMAALGKSHGFRDVVLDRYQVVSEANDKLRSRITTADLNREEAARRTVGEVALDAAIYALALGRVKEVDQALEALDEATYFWPGDEAGWLLTSAVALQMGRSTVAAEVAERGLTTFPESVRLLRIQAWSKAAPGGTGK